MNWLEALFLGIVQGLTEFFPVSSSGHLVLAQDVLGVELPGILFDVVVHIGTLVAVLVVYRRKLIELLLGLASKGDSTWPYVLKLGIATVPAAVVGLTFSDWFELRFDDPVFASTMILVTGTIVWSSRWALGTHPFGPLELLPLLIGGGLSLYAGTAIPFLAVLTLLAVVMGVSRLTAPKTRVAPEPGWLDAILMGLAQAIAIFPGITRSGSTVVTGLWRRIDPVAAAEFSFLMSIPAILGAAVLQVPDAMSADLGVSPGAIFLGFAAAALSGILAIRFFVALLKRQNFYVFAYYCWFVAGLYLVLA